MNAFQSGFMNGQGSDDNYQEFYEKFQKLYHYEPNDDNDKLDPENGDSSDNKKRKPKKGKNGGKLSHEEIRNLSTEELFSYIENEGKKLKQAAANPSNSMKQDLLNQTAEAMA